jgi:6-pyruvoyltetrahydropterin/6-carboxytetrahydropterin synthase
MCSPTIARSPKDGYLGVTLEIHRIKMVSLRACQLVVKLPHVAAKLIFKRSSFAEVAECNLSTKATKPDSGLNDLLTNMSPSSLLRILCIAGILAQMRADRAFKLGIRDSFMIAHSFHQHPSFGPAGGLHGATYTCDVEFCTDRLNQDTNWVIDIGRASDILRKVLSRYNFKNLDEIFADRQLTTTEFMCRQIHSDLKELLKSDCPDFKGDICVKLWESHKAWASFAGPAT